MGQRLELTAIEFRHQRAKPSADPGRVVAGVLAPIHDEILNVAAKISDAVRFPNATLADFKETAVARNDIECPIEKLASKRIEHDIDAAPSGDFHDLIGERNRTRIQDVRDAQGFEEGPFFRRSGCSEDFCTGALCERERG